MANPQALGSALGGYNPVFTPAANATLQSAQQQQQLGQALLSQGLTPLDINNRQVDGAGYSISPLEGLAKLAQVLSGRSDISDANQQVSDLYSGGQSQATPSQDTAANLARGLSSDPGTLSNSQGSGQSAATSPYTADAQAAIARGVANGLPASLAQADMLTDLPGYIKNFYAPTDLQKMVGSQEAARETMGKANVDSMMKVGANDMAINPTTGQQIIPGLNQGFVQGQQALESQKALDTATAPMVAQTLPAGQMPGVNPMLPNLVRAESGGNTQAVSPVGAKGAFQIMPATAANPGYGITPLQGMTNGDPRTAPIAEQQRFANDYLNKMQQLAGGNPQMAAAAYNAGPATMQNAMAANPGDPSAAMQMMPIGTQLYAAQVAGGQPPVPNGQSNAAFQAQMDAYKAQQTAQAQVVPAADKANAEDNAKNLADLQKTYDVASGNLPRALQRFQQLRAASQTASSGGGVSDVPDGGEGFLDKLLPAASPTNPDYARNYARSWLGQQLEPGVATANDQLEQAANQGVLAEMGPQMAGLRGGNKFLEVTSSKASGLDPASPDSSRQNVINGLQDQYLSSMKGIADERRALGDPNAPSDLQIAQQIGQYAQPNYQVSVVSPDGQLGRIPASHLASLIQAGGKLR